MRKLSATILPAWTALAALVLLGAAWSHPLRGQVILHEFMAENGSSLENDGSYPDWVELYNTNSTPLNISGWRLSDDHWWTNVAGNHIFTFPAGTVVDGRGYLIVFCDDATNSPGLHTLFNLGRKGGYIGLKDASNVTRDSVWYGLQAQDFSVGRVPSGGTNAFQLCRPTPLLANVAQPLGPTNGLRINEWAATNNPAPGSSNPGKDWLEICNTDTNPVSMSLCIITSEVGTPSANYTIFSNLTFIGPESFLKFDCVGKNDAKDNDELRFKLSHNSGETLTLYWTNIATIIHRLTFPGNDVVPDTWAPDVSWGWLPDGNVNNMVRFATNLTTAGKSNFQPLTNLVVNELLAHTDLPLEDAVEFYNPTPNPVDISRWYLSDTRNNRLKFRIPSNTVVAPYGFKVVYEMQGATNGFNTNGTGNTPCFTFSSAYEGKVVLTAASNDAAGTLTGYELVQTFTPSANGVSFGRHVRSDGQADFVAMPQLSFGTNVTRTDPPDYILRFRKGLGATNPYPLVGPLVISEIMYHPPDILQTNCALLPCVVAHIDDSTNEFIEIFNLASTNVPLYDPTLYYHPDYGGGTIPYANGRTNTWRLRGTVDYDFPTNITLPSSNYLLVVNFNPTNTAQLNLFRQQFAVPASVQVFGPYKGKLSNKGGSVELRRPDWPQGPNHPEDFGYVPYLSVEDIQYQDSSPWPTNADGFGFSLHRAVPQGYGNDPTNWVESVPSPGRSQIVMLRAPRYINDYFYVDVLTLAGSSYTLLLHNNVDAPFWDWGVAMSLDPLPTNAWRTVWEGPRPPTWPRRFYKVVSPKIQ